MWLGLYDVPTPNVHSCVVNVPLEGPEISSRTRAWELTTSMSSIVLPDSLMAVRPFNQQSDMLQAFDTRGRCGRGHASASVGIKRTSTRSDFPRLSDPIQIFPGRSWPTVRYPSELFPKSSKAGVQARARSRG